MSTSLSPFNKDLDENVATKGSARPYTYQQLLALEEAPKGDPASDLKTAIYLCACTNHYNFEDALAKRKFLILGFYLASVGFKGDTTHLVEKDYLDTLKELIAEGALEHIGNSAGFIPPAFKKESSGTIKCAYVSVFKDNMFFEKNELRFEDDSGEYPAFSRFLIIPGDEVKVVINTLMRCAYVVEVVKLRSMVICESTYSNSVFVREKGFKGFDIRIENQSRLRENTLAIAQIVERKSPNIIMVKIRELIDDLGSLNTFIYKAVLEHNIPNTFPEAVKASIDSIPNKVKKSELKGRVDLRHLPLVTIDGEDAKDFDDAVYCEKVNRKYHLYVAIADVSYYVRQGSAIDHEAQNRCNSVYFPYFVIPMLPEQLSNGICSLNPQVDRLCMVCQMVINTKGKIESYEFYPAVMRSHARLTYTEAHQMITTNEAIKKEHQELIAHIKNLYNLYLLRKKEREARGAFEFESTEVHFLFDKDGYVKGMEGDERNEAHMLIEECMIAANICAAEFVKLNKLETLYRIHPKVEEQKLEKLRQILSRYGIDLKGGDSPSSHDFKEVSEQVLKLHEGVHQIIALQLLRAMSKATYDPNNIGHFGLALDNYAHFTSPIRRYADLQLHRVIKYILEQKQKRSWGNIGALIYSKESLIHLGKVCSDREKAAADAEFDVDNSLKCEYVANFLECVVAGTISTIGSNGVFVTLNDFYIDGMIAAQYCGPINANEGTMTLYNHVYRVGEQINVRIIRVDSMLRRIHLLPVVEGGKKNKLVNISSISEPLKKKAVKEVKIDNQEKIDLFERISDISRGKDAKDEDLTKRDLVSFSLEEDLGEFVDQKSKKSKKSKKAKAIDKIINQEAQAIVDAITPKDKKTKTRGKKAKKVEVIVGDNFEEEVNPKTKSKSKNSKKAKVEDKAEAKTKSKKSTKNIKESEVVDSLISEAANYIDADLTKSSSTKKNKANTTQAQEATVNSAVKTKSKSKAKSKEDLTTTTTTASVVDETKPKRKSTRAKKAKTVAQE